MYDLWPKFHGWLSTWHKQGNEPNQHVPNSDFNETFTQTYLEGFERHFKLVSITLQMSEHVLKAYNYHILIFLKSITSILSTENMWIMMNESVFNGHIPNNDATVFILKFHASLNTKGKKCIISPHRPKY